MSYNYFNKARNTNQKKNIMSILLAITFCSAITCEEYVVDHNLTHSDCIERMQEERKLLMSTTVEKAYNEYMESFKAEHMKGKAKSWEINCVEEGNKW